MPRRLLSRERLLHEHVVVVEPHLLRSHEHTGDVGSARREGDRLELGHAGPRAEVLDEASGVVVTARGEEERTGMSEHLLDPALDRSHLVGTEEPTHDDGTMRAEVRDRLVVDHGRIENAAVHGPDLRTATPHRLRGAASVPAPEASSEPQSSNDVPACKDSRASTVRLSPATSSACGSSARPISARNRSATVTP